jgi:hypothetical protein
MGVTEPYEFIGLGAMGVTKPHEFIGFGAMDVAKPLEEVGMFGEIELQENRFGALWPGLRGWRFSETNITKLVRGFAVHQF